LLHFVLIFTHTLKPTLLEMILLQLGILLACILTGSRMKGIGLGVMGMLGLLVFIFIFHLRPGDPPLDVMLIIMAVVTTGAALQAAGGMDYLVHIAERIIRSNPCPHYLLCPVYRVFFMPVCRHIAYCVLGAARYCGGVGQKTYPA
jgi:anaerobic C4-dicarboxylate transporter DcuA